MHRRNRIVFCLKVIISALIIWLPVYGGGLRAEESAGGNKPLTLEAMTVREVLATPTRQEGDLLYTSTEVTADGIKLAGPGASSRTGVGDVVDILTFGLPALSAFSRQTQV